MNEVDMTKQPLKMATDKERAAVAGDRAFAKVKEKIKARLLAKHSKGKENGRDKAEPRRDGRK